MLYPFLRLYLPEVRFSRFSLSWRRRSRQSAAVKYKTPPVTATSNPKATKTRTLSAVVST
jgi:hypothetical protein